jgi:hypothetical protein
MPASGEWREELSYLSTDIGVHPTDEFFVGKQDSGNVELAHKFMPLIDDTRPADDIRIHVVDRDGATLGVDRDNSIEYTSETSIGSKNGYGGDNVIKTAEVSLIVATDNKYADWVYIPVNLRFAHTHADPDARRHYFRRSMVPGQGDQRNRIDGNAGPLPLEFPGKHGRPDGRYDQAVAGD